MTTQFADSKTENEILVSELAKIKQERDEALARLQESEILVVSLEQ